jgi:hypothetical protein
LKPQRWPVFNSISPQWLSTEQAALPQFACLVWADPATDRAFFVRRTNSGKSEQIFHAHFADAYTGWAVGTDGTIPVTRDGGRAKN